MRYLTLIVLIIYWPVISLAANGDTLWTRTFGGSDNEYAYFVQQTSDGGFVITGETNSYGAGFFDLYLAKVGSSGAVEWERTFGGSNYEIGRCVRQTVDGGYVAVGATRSYGAGSSDVYLVKTSANGDSIWANTYGFEGWDEAYSVQQTSDGGYLVLGWTDRLSDESHYLFVVKTDSNGGLLWTRSLTSFEGSGRAITTDDGGYLIGGNYTDTINYVTDIHLMKIDDYGVILWDRLYGGDDDDIFRDFIKTSDGGYMVTGRTVSYGHGGEDCWLLKIDAEGDVIWSGAYGGYYNDKPWRVRETPDGGYLVAGDTWSNSNGLGDVYAFKVDALGGGPRWCRNYGGIENDAAYCLDPTTDGGYVLAGWTKSYGAGEFDCYLLRIAPEGIPMVSVSIGTEAHPFTIWPGRSFSLNASIRNNTARPLTGDVWIKLRLPNGSYYGPIARIDDMSLDPYQQVIARNLRQQTPGYAPLGEYKYICYCGRYPNLIVDSSYLEFTMVAPVSDCAGEWCLSGFFDYNVGAGIPFELSLLNNCPNPFNAVTTISFDLQRPGNVRLEVYNLTGQRVATLVDGRIDTGYHSVQWDASAYSSGVYFYRLTADEGVFTKRMTLLK
jgi:hypothetical protein